MSAVTGAESGSLWQWHAHPDVWVLVTALSLAYIATIGIVGPKRVRPGREPATRNQKLLFFCGIFALWLSADWPLHDISERHLFSAHMIQHLSFMLVVPPLLLLGIPGWVWRMLFAPRPIFSVVRVITRPVPALLLSNAVVAFIHWPTVVELQVSSEPAHLAIHTLLTAAMLLMWWPVVAPLPELSSLSQPAKMFYLFLQSFVPTVPASFLTFAQEPVYRVYENMRLLWGVSALTDQRVAGLIMKIGGGLVLWAVIAVLFFKWQARDEADVGDELTWDDFERELRLWDLRK